MSNPNYPSFKRTIPVQAQQATLPPCPELRDMRNVLLVDEEDRWYPNLDAATEEALSRGHSEGLAGSGGTLPERLDRFGWGPLPAGAASTGHFAGAGGQFPYGGHPVAGGYAAARVYPMAGSYSASQAHPAGGYPASGYPRGSSNSQGGGYPRSDGHASGGHPQRGGYPRR
ncbi:hypothetical protein FRC06_001302 [Ceratobasidium sp. 370]|nr:hypothetical protein FRC06_001302 [Ceratobasidium sp. 370]